MRIAGWLLLTSTSPREGETSERRKEEGEEREREMW